jgi:hypothetical protein
MEMTANFGQDYVELPCYNIISNCAICGGFQPYKCKLCFDGYYLVDINTNIDHENLNKLSDDIKPNTGKIV